MQTHRPPHAPASGNGITGVLAEDRLHRGYGSRFGLVDGRAARVSRGIFKRPCGRARAGPRSRHGHDGNVSSMIRRRGTRMPAGAAWETGSASPARDPVAGTGGLLRGAGGWQCKTEL